MPTKPRTKKPAAKPQRKTRAVRETATDAIARNVADALGRRLDDLLAVKQGTAVDAWQATEKEGRIVASYAECSEPVARTSPIEEAVTRLLQAVNAAECLTDSTGDRLMEIMGPAIPQATTPSISKEPSNTSELAARLNGIADRIYADGRRRLDILNRLEL